MGRKLEDILPPCEELLKLEPEEIATLLLDYLCELDEGSRGSSINSYNVTSASRIKAYAGDKCKEAQKVLMEAWIWLEREGMLAPMPDEPTSTFRFITRRGYKLREKSNMETYKKSYLLPKASLDETLVRKVYPLFIRGDYDIAVFQAYKEIEIGVRDKAGLPSGLIGTDLMRKAFHPQEGILTNKKANGGERQAVSDLFAGAIGLFKNPSSHRDVNYDDPSEVAELILLANYLLRFIDRLTSITKENKGRP